MKTNNYLITFTNNDLLKLKVKNINFLFPIKDYSVGFIKTFLLEDINIPNSYIYINRILDKEAISKLKEDLPKLNKNIIGICFTDLGIINLIKELNINLKLIYMQNHNTTNYESINYYLDYVDSVLISTDITENEIIEILDKAKKKLVIPFFGLVDAMYSRRTLLTNFKDKFNLETQNIENLYESTSNQNFLAIENKYGTILYSKKYIDYRHIEHHNILYRFINPINLDLKTIESILNYENLDDISNKGFLNTETYYKLKDKNL